jgi:hypothetical protein
MIYICLPEGYILPLNQVVINSRQKRRWMGQRLDNMQQEYRVSTCHVTNKLTWFALLIQYVTLESLFELISTNVTAAIRVNGFDQILSVDV